MVMAFLRYAPSGREVQFFPLEKEVVTVGRSRECDIQVEDLNVSRRHFQVRRLEGGFVLEDLGSKNGTFVNGAPVQRWSLSDGDLISAGEQKFLFKLQK